MNAKDTILPSIQVSRNTHRHDLIDLSQDDNKSNPNNNILELFDPLTHNNKHVEQADADQRSRTQLRLSRHPSRLKHNLSLRSQRSHLRSSSVSIITAKSDAKASTYDNIDLEHNVQTTAGDTLDRSLSVRSPAKGLSSSMHFDQFSNDDIAAAANRSRYVNVAAICDNRTNNRCKFKLIRKHQRSSQELTQLVKKIKSFRAQYKHSDEKTNSGIVLSSTLYSPNIRELSIKIIITSPLAKEPIIFTCSVATTIEHLISHAICTMFDEIGSDDCMTNYMLKITGKDEFLESQRCLADYSIISQCCKFDKDLHLTVVHRKQVKRTYARTSKDDFQCNSLLCADDILSRTAILKYSDLSYESLNIIMDAFERESNRLYEDVTQKFNSLQTQSLLQTTKAICALMMSCEPGQLSDSKDNLAELCRSYKNEGEHLSNEDRYKMIEVIQHAIEKLKLNMHKLVRLTSANLPVDFEVEGEDAASATPPAHNNNNAGFVDTPIDLVKDQVSIRVELVSQLRPEWVTRYHDYYIELRLMHGDRQLCAPARSSRVRSDRSFFDRLLFDEQLILPMNYATLPREARFAFTLFGIEPPDAVVAAAASGNMLAVPERTGDVAAPNDDNAPMGLKRSSSSSSVCSTAPMYTGARRSLVAASIGEGAPQPLAVSMAYVFDHKLALRQAEKLLPMYSLPQQTNNKQDNDDDDDIYVESFVDRTSPVLLIEFKRFPPEKRVYFPCDDDKAASDNAPCINRRDFESLDPGTQFALNKIVNDKQCHEQLSDDEKALVWLNRFHLLSIPHALPKLLLSVPSWSRPCLQHLRELIDAWAPMTPVDALQLLLPAFPDAYVRRKAVEWLSTQSDDELCDYMPQLLQAMRYERVLDCALFWLLMKRALENPRLAIAMYWQIKLIALDELVRERAETLNNCLLWTLGSAFWKSVDKQKDFLDKLTVVSNKVKGARDNRRKSVLKDEIALLQDYMMERKPTMPWAPGVEICDIELENCSYFPSNTLPLKLALRSCEPLCNQVPHFSTHNTIFKVGDDLRQDMLAIQMIRIMEKLWLREGLDLRIVTFDCLATDERQGFVEMVSNAETLRKIQQQSSMLTGAFKSAAIDKYIAMWNTSELEYKTAINRFVHSCAGYSVATYILGICDRHNDNIMITTSGHFFHIDFGKFLGDAQMLGAIKRDRTPFVLTADMAYVINGGDRPSKKFQSFIELCTMAFNIIRRHRNLFLSLFSLMSSAKINGLTSDAVRYIDKMLMPHLSETEAMAKFTRLIEECLSSRSTQLNFLLHSLAQMRFSGDSAQCKQAQLLSFVPKTFTMQQDGRLEALDIVEFKKKYEPEKQYYYIVYVKRAHQPDPTYIARTFREFSELQMKLMGMFPHVIMHDINRCVSHGHSLLMDLIGRNNTREVAERRLVELRIFVRNLLALPGDVAHCDLIYTFFHPILRDQQLSSMNMSVDNGDVNNTSVVGAPSTGHQLNESYPSAFGAAEYTDTQRHALYLGSNGQVKLSIAYKNMSLVIMIMHAKNLACPEGQQQGPNCYAKTYLLPDQAKQTKRKTKVVSRSCHPTFMELIVYDYPLQMLKNKTLQVSIWHSELVQQKAFMGAALVPLDSLEANREIVAWYPLKNY